MTDRTNAYIVAVVGLGLSCGAVVCVFAPAAAGTQLPIILALVGGVVAMLKKTQETDAKAAAAASSAASAANTAANAAASSRQDIQNVTSKIERAATVAARETRLTAESLAITTAETDRKMAGLEKVTNAVHTLVNSNFAMQLKVAAVALRRVADLTCDPADRMAADLAESALRDHQAKQQTVDAGQSIVPEGMP